MVQAPACRRAIWRAFDFAHQAVHNLLQRLDLAGGVTVVLLERIHGAVHDILNGGLQNGKIVDRFAAEVDGFS